MHLIKLKVEIFNRMRNIVADVVLFGLKRKRHKPRDRTFHENVTTRKRFIVHGRIGGGGARVGT